MAPLYNRSADPCLLFRRKKLTVHDWTTGNLLSPQTDKQRNQKTEGPVAPAVTCFHNMVSADQNSSSVDESPSKLDSGDISRFVWYSPCNILHSNSNSNSLLYQQPPVPGRWGYYDRENLTKKLN